MLSTPIFSNIRMCSSSDALAIIVDVPNSSSSRTDMADAEISVPIATTPTSAFSAPNLRKICFPSFFISATA